MEIKEIKKALLRGDSIRLTNHTLRRIAKRGYTKTDLISCILNGEITRLQTYRNRLSALIEGVDKDGLPMVVVVGYDFTKKTKFAIVTALPPIEEKFKRVI